MNRVLNYVGILICFCVIAFEAPLFSDEPCQQDKSFVFVILCHVRNEEDDQLWRRCYASVRKFYPTAPVVIIDDNSPIPVSADFLDDGSVIRSEFPGAGELLPYYYFLKYKWADQMIFLHDSMLLKRAFTDHELSSPVKFHWHFDDHAQDENFLINSLLRYLEQGGELIDYNMNNKDLWNGWFGVAGIIDLTVLKQVEKKYGLISSLKHVIRCRKQRCALERVFGLILFKELYVSREDCSNFGEIYHHPYYYSNIDEGALEELKLSYPGAIIKTWHGR